MVVWGVLWATIGIARGIPFDAFGYGVNLGLVLVVGSGVVWVVISVYRFIRNRIVKGGGE